MGIADAIANSRVRAGAFTRSLFGEQWDAERGNATIATASAVGQPHAAVVIAASVADEIYFTVHPNSVLARNLAANDRIALSVCDSVHAVMSQGRAERVGAATDLAPLIESIANATAAGRFTPDGWDGDIYRADLSRLVAN